MVVCYTSVYCMMQPLHIIFQSTYHKLEENDGAHRHFLSMNFVTGQQKRVNGHNYFFFQQGVVPSWQLCEIAIFSGVGCQNLHIMFHTMPLHPQTLACEWFFFDSVITEEAYQDLLLYWTVLTMICDFSKAMLGCIWQRILWQVHLIWPSYNRNCPYIIFCGVTSRIRCV